MGNNKHDTDASSTVHGQVVLARTDVPAPGAPLVFECIGETPHSANVRELGWWSPLLRCCRSDPEAVAGVLVVCDSYARQNRAYPLHKPRLQDWYTVGAQKEGTLSVPSLTQVVQQRRHWTQLVTSCSEDHLGTCSKLVTLGCFQMYLDHCGCQMAVDGYVAPRMARHFIEFLRHTAEEFSQVEKKKTPKKAVAATAHITSLAGFASPVHA